MKKSLLTLLMSAALITPALADPSAKLEYKYEDNVNAGDDRSGVKATVANEVIPGINGDASIEWLKSADSGDVRVRYEAGATASVIENIFVRLGTGYKTKTDDDGFVYYVIEPGFSLPVSDDISTSIAYRWRAPFDSEINDATHTIKFGASYNLLENISVGAGYDFVRGDVDYNGYNVGVRAVF